MESEPHRILGYGDVGLHFAIAILGLEFVERSSGVFVLSIALLLIILDNLVPDHLMQHVSCFNVGIFSNYGIPHWRSWQPRQGWYLVQTIAAAAWIGDRV